jgi:hypothetical protein
MILGVANQVPVEAEDDTAGSAANFHQTDRSNIGGGT